MGIIAIATRYISQLWIRACIPVFTLWELQDVRQVGLCLCCPCISPETEGSKKQNTLLDYLHLTSVRGKKRVFFVPISREAWLY
jgi:hypothetical protein